MSKFSVRAFSATLTWIHLPAGGPHAGDSSESLEFRGSLVFADTRRGELFSVSASATAKIHPTVNGNWARVDGQVLLPPELIEYAKVGRQFILVRGPECDAVGNITSISAA